MKKIKTFLSGINNMLLFLFKVDLTKWKLLFDNTFWFIRAYTVSCSFNILPIIEFLVLKDFQICGTPRIRLIISFRFLHCILYISFNNK